MPTRSAAGSISVTMTDANRLAFAAPLTATSSTGNQGTGLVDGVTLGTHIDIYDTAAQADLQASIEGAMPLKMVFSAASGGSQTYTLYDVLGNSISTGSITPGNSNSLSVTVPANPPSVPSEFTFEMTFSGTPASGDSFTFSFNADGDSDNRNALALLDLQTANTIGKTSITGAYSQLIEQVGAQTSQAKLDATATESILTQAQSSVDSTSGVNLDEEAANLVKFQQYYTASAQVIKTAQTIFDTLISSI